MRVSMSVLVTRPVGDPGILPSSRQLNDHIILVTNIITNGCRC